MCSWPITDEVPDVDAKGQCAMCDEVFPFVNVLSCRRLKGGELPICLTCHQRFHPACTTARSLLRASHYECHVCGVKQADVVCALCSTTDSKDEILEGVLMCDSCSNHIHNSAKRHHSDHFYPVASRAVVPVNGPVQWHNFVDVTCEISTNHSQPRLPARQYNSTQQARPQSSANQHRDSSQRSQVSDLKHLVIGGNIGQPLMVKKKVRGGPYERFSRVV